MPLSENPNAKLVSPEEPPLLSRTPSPPLLLSTEKTIFKEPTTNSSRLGLPFCGLEHKSPEESCFTGPDPPSSASVAHPAIPQFPARPPYLPTPRQTPERRTIGPDSGIETLHAEDLLPSALPRPYINQDAQFCPSLSASETSQELFNSSPNFSDWSFTSFDQSNPKESSFLSSVGRFFRPFKLTNILASPRPRLAGARRAHGRVQAVLRLIKAYEAGNYLGPQLVIRRRLYSSEYKDLLALVEADEELERYFYTSSKLRFDYSHTTHYFTLYMITALHENFVQSISKKIQEFLDEHKQSECNVVSKIAKSLEGVGSGNVVPPEIEYNGKQPDQGYQLLFDGCEYPGLVIEVAWNQNKSDLKEKAKHYFECTNGQIRTVVGLNLNDIYVKQQAAEKKWKTLEEKWKKGKANSRPEPLTLLAPTAATTPATFSIWRAKYSSRTKKTTFRKDSVEDQVFRKENQQGNPKVNLKLSLEDFVWAQNLDELCEAERGKPRKIEYPELVISSESLCGLFKTAVDIYRPAWRREQIRSANFKQKKENDAIVARKKEAATLVEEAEHKYHSPGLSGRFRDSMGRLKSARHRKREEQESPRSRDDANLASMSGANAEA